MPSNGLVSSVRRLNDDSKRDPDIDNSKNGLKHSSKSDDFIRKQTSCHQELFEDPPYWAAIITYLGYLILNVFGWFRDLLRYFGLEDKKGACDNNPPVSLFTILENNIIIDLFRDY